MPNCAASLRSTSLCLPAGLCAAEVGYSSIDLPGKSRCFFKPLPGVTPGLPGCCGRCILRRDPARSLQDRSLCGRVNGRAAAAGFGRATRGCCAVHGAVRGPGRHRRPRRAPLTSRRSPLRWYPAGLQASRVCWVRVGCPWGKCLWPCWSARGKSLRGGWGGGSISGTCVSEVTAEGTDLAVKK